MPFDQTKNITELVDQLQQKTHALMRAIPLSIPSSHGADELFGVPIIEKVTEPAVRELMAIHDICLISKDLLKKQGREEEWIELEKYKPLLLDTKGNFLALQGRTTLELAENMSDFLKKLEAIDSEEENKHDNH